MKSSTGEGVQKQQRMLKRTLDRGILGSSICSIMRGRFIDQGAGRGGFGICVEIKIGDELAWFNIGLLGSCHDHASERGSLYSIRILGVSNGRESFRRHLPLGHVSLQLLELLLEPLSKHVNVECGSVVDTPDEHDGQEGTACPLVPEPERTGDNREDGVYILDHHEGWFLQWQGEMKHEFADPRFSIGSTQPGETSWAACSNLISLAHSDEEVVAQLPDGIGNRRPDHHSSQCVVFGRARGAKLDPIHRRESCF